MKLFLFFIFFLSFTLHTYSDESFSKKEALVFSFVGDIMAHDVNYNRKPYSHIYENVKETLLKDDLSFANLEFSIDKNIPYSNYPLFNVHPEYVQAAINAGFDVFSLANNHISDQGKESLINTFKEMDEMLGIHFSGIEIQSQNILIPRLIEIKGWKIGFLSVTTFLNLYKGSEHVNLIDPGDVTKRSSFIDYIKSVSKEFDLFILSIHMGREYSLYADEKKMVFLRELVKAGVHIVWGHHPHVVQEWETVKNGHNDSLILPSCGNFISGQTWFIDPKSPNEKRVYTGDSAIYEVHLSMVDGLIKIDQLEANAISNYRDPQKGMIVDYMDELVLRSDLPLQWTNYYKNRYEMLKLLLRDKKKPLK